MRGKKSVPGDPLTERQSEILDFIRVFVEINGYPPSYREIGDAFDFHAHAANAHINALVKKGVLTKAKGIARGIRVVTQE